MKCERYKLDKDGFKILCPLNVKCPSGYSGMCNNRRKDRPRKKPRMVSVKGWAYVNNGNTHATTEKGCLGYNIPCTITYKEPKK